MMDTAQYSGWPLAVITASVVVYLYFRDAFSYWKKRGVPCPEIYPFVGNFFLVGFASRQLRWALEYGKVLGSYERTRPALIISDVDVMREICVKHFHIFPNHTNAEFNSRLASRFVFNAQDDQWRNIRAIMSPTFTASKMRRMHKLLDQCADQVLEALQESLKGNPVVNIKDLFSLYTMDAIASCCYAFRLASNKSDTSLKTATKQDEFVRLGMEMFNFELWRLFMVFAIDGNILKYFNFGLVSPGTEWALARQVLQIIERRDKSGKYYDDYLQTLINAKSGSDEVRKGEQSLMSSDKRGEEKATERELSEIDVLSNATYLLLVGLETTSTLLTHCVYALSFHQSIQEKLHQTIKSLAEFDDQNRATFDHDTLMSCEYLDAVISETLRSHPPVTGTDRVASEDHHLESHKILIPKGMRVFFSLIAIMNDPDIWPEPEVFNPDRFMPGQREGRDPLAFCPFGIGPRYCLGKRFALTEAKIALAKLVLDYRFEPAPGTRYPGEDSGAAGFNNLKRPEVTIIKR